jgi:FlaA1/EpsC-like NDP-sugar epimerase
MTQRLDIAQLLGRARVETDIAAVASGLVGQRVLVTGAGGSIGAELCRQVLRCSPAELVLLGHGENSIFAIDAELARSAGTTRIHPVIADIREAKRLAAVFAAYQPDIVFHAAAHKHVPLMEAQPAEAVTNNVTGTRLLLAEAQSAGVRRFVLVSSDKAVNPASVMGVSKRVAELLVHAAAHASELDYLVVRFGNVLGSRGSVSETLRTQIANGGPVTVTHPEMTRYFMSVAEAVELILQAAVLGRGGEVFVFDMGQPVPIVDLARAMIRLAGLRPDEDIAITFSGVRPGEKIAEELVRSDECYRPTAHPRIFAATVAGRSIPPDLERLVAMLEDAATTDDRGELPAAFQRIVPDYIPAGGHVASRDDRVLVQP